MRLFVGLPIPARLAQALAHLAQATGLANARWTPPENIHLTLVFLGEVAEDRLPTVVHELNELDAEPLQIRLTRLDTFARAGVLFVDVEPTPKLLQFQAQVATGMARCGFGLEPRPYHPHITLARLRQPGKLNGKHLTLPPALQHSFAVDAVNLYRSHTTPGGPHYEVLAQNRL
ncbi:MAG: RNA 2',3'-cyclic phosphodiesterase [Acidobacteriaceae bacterium]|jgi:2'-5' RNA ligase